MNKNKLFKKIEEEGDVLHFEYRNINCICLRMKRGRNINGYIGLPKNSRFYGQYYDNMNHFIDIHGGLTYSSPINPSSNSEDGYWWIGFDTSHISDIVPDCEFTYQEYTTYKDMDFVKSELKSFVDQIKELDE